MGSETVIVVDDDAAVRRSLRLSLQKRGWEVEAFASADLTNKHIARQLGISHRTVDQHRARVMEKCRPSPTPTSSPSPASSGCCRRPTN